MAILFLVAMGIVTVAMWRKANSQQKMGIILIVAIMFMLMACGDCTSNCGQDWNLDNSSDLTGVIWRALP